MGYEGSEYAKLRGDSQSQVQEEEMSPDVGKQMYWERGQGRLGVMCLLDDERLGCRDGTDGQRARVGPRYLHLDPDLLC